MSQTLGILSYNIHKGYSTGNRRNILKQLRQAIHEIPADLIFLQEVLGHGTPQFEYLAESIWPHHAYGKNAVYTSGHHGNAILSKYPFTSWENIDVSTNRLERRGLLHGVIQVPHHRKPLHAICVHLGLLETERQSQIQQICQRIDRLVPHDEPVIIGGDFNDWRGRVSKPLERKAELKEAFLELTGSHARSFPSWMPTLRLDRIYYRGVKLLNAEALTGLPWSQLSDHVALYAQMKF